MHLMSCSVLRMRVPKLCEIEPTSYLKSHQDVTSASAISLRLAAATVQCALC